jgi:creatinine amidohydrolase/Fe(II)-dependent formamide hydrolase-like protein
MTRALAENTWQEVERLSKNPGVVVLPIGAIEQHGPHLPLLTDARLAEEIVRRACAKLPDSVNAWYLPTLPYGKSTEHIGYAGTVSLSAATLIAVVSDIARSLHASGFRRLLFFNAHGGNLALLQMVARDIRAELGMLCVVAMPDMTQALSEFGPQERRFGLHGGTLETAWMLALAPELVKAGAKAHYPDLPWQHLHLTALPQVAWLTRDWSPEGHFGDPSAATKEAGERWLLSAAEHLARLITEVSSLEVAHG